MADGVKIPSGAVYLYAVTAERSAAPRPLGAPGINGWIIGIPAGPLTAWISEIDARGFAEALERNIENLDWLAEATLRHQKAITTIAESTAKTLLPTRFGVVFSNPASLVADVKRRSQELQKAARRVAGCEEWGVKVFQAVQASANAAFKTASSGSDYLRKKAVALGEGGGSSEDLRTFAADLAKIARGSSQTGKVSSGQKGLQWQATFLVPRSRRKQWDKILLLYATRWHGERSIECTGPWPPYSFVNE